MPGTYPASQEGRPEAANARRANMFIGVAFVEVLALLGLVAGFLF